MRKPLRLAALAVATAATGLLAFMPGLTAHAAPLVQLCSFNNSDHCMNRGGGGTGNGTHVITYHQDDGNNDFTLVSTSGSVCGQYNTVHNGESGCTGPFVIGSGLNARYDTKPVVEVYAYNEAKCAAIPSFVSALSVLEDCGANGYAYVESIVSGKAYLVSVGESNYQYNQNHVGNTPYWLDDIGIPNQMINSLDASSDTPWGCVGTGIGLC